MVTRDIAGEIGKCMFQNKAIIIYGARQVGKTTLVEQVVRNYPDKALFLNGDEADVRELLTGVNPARIKPVIGDHKIVVIDEAQRIPEAGIALKILYDHFKGIQFIATGSSAFELANKIKEPLTGRKFEFFLHPFSFGEMEAYHGFLTETRLLENRMIFGYYPDIALNPGRAVKLLKSLASNFLYKDLLNLEQIQKPVLLEKLLKALALQVGSEVSMNELAQLLKHDRGTVEKYIDLLEKAYIIFSLHGLNRNVRNEIKKGRKIYFYDNGIRNAILGNFLPLSNRGDIGALWENFLISERHKLLSNNEIHCSTYFWRTTQQQEIDYIEERQGTFHAFEFKWNPRKSSRLSKTFLNGYPTSTFKLISPENLREFLKPNNGG